MKCLNSFGVGWFFGSFSCKVNVSGKTLSLCRMERLQRVVSKVQMESVVCEEQLNQVEALLRTVRRSPGVEKHTVWQRSSVRVRVRVLQDTRMLSSGKPAQHMTEMEADLDKAEAKIRLLFNDVQLLKDGRHLQAEQMYRRCKRSHWA